MTLTLKKDKAKHFAASFGLTIGAFLATGKFWIAILAVVVIGGTKEIYDYYFGGVASWEDMIANILGMCFALVFLFIVIEIKKEKS